MYALSFSQPMQSPIRFESKIDVDWMLDNKKGAPFSAPSQFS